MSLLIAIRPFEPVLHAYQRESRTSATVGLDAFDGVMCMGCGIDVPGPR